MNFLIRALLQRRGGISGMLSGSSRLTTTCVFCFFVFFGIGGGASFLVIVPRGLDGAMRMRVKRRCSLSCVMYLLEDVREVHTLDAAHSTLPFGDMYDYVDFTSQ